MGISILKDTSTEIELILKIQIDPETLSQFIDQAYAYIAQREGVPVYSADMRAFLLEKMPEALLDENVANAVMNMASPFARSRVHGVTTVGSPLFPKRGELTEGQPFKFRAVWAKLPEVELSSYDPVEIEVASAEPTEADIDEQIALILAQHSTLVPCEDKGSVVSGASVSLKLKTTLNGEEVPGLCFDERPYTTGLHNMPEDFERNIVGMSVGETKRFEFEGPADVDDEGNAVMETYESEATVLGMMCERSPELTDAWVKANAAGCSTVSQFRNSIADQLAVKSDEERRHYINYLAASKLAERFSGSIPDEAYEAVRDEIKSQFNMEAAQLGITPDQYMEQQGMNEQQFGIRMVLQARERLVQSMALDAYARHFNLAVEEDDLNEFFATSAGTAQAATLRQQLEGSGRMYLAYEGALRLKANDYLVAHAVITEKGSNNSNML